MREQVFHPAFGEHIYAEERLLPDEPDAQVAATVAIMRELVNADAPYMGREAAQAGANDPRLSDLEKCKRLWRYVKGKLTFVEDGTLTGMFKARDPQTPVVEALIRPVDMARMCAGGSCKRVGDCDDFSMYLAALLKYCGVECKFATIAADPQAPGRFSHVYVVAYADGERLPLDASHGPHAGWESPKRFRLQEWPISGANFVTGLAIGLAVAYYVQTRDA